MRTTMRLAAFAAVLSTLAFTLQDTESECEDACKFEDDGQTTAAPCSPYYYYSLPWFYLVEIEDGFTDGECEEQTVRVGDSDTEEPQYECRCRSINENCQGTITYTACAPDGWIAGQQGSIRNGDQCINSGGANNGCMSLSSTIDNPDCGAEGNEVEFELYVVPCGQQNPFWIPPCVIKMKAKCSDCAEFSRPGRC